MLRRPSLLVVSLFALSFFPALSQARTLVLRADGTGDVPTFQAGVDSLIRVEGLPDTLRVEPGYYDESVVVSEPVSDFGVIECPGGPAITEVRELTFIWPRTHHGDVIGLGIRKTVRAEGDSPVFRSCVLNGGFIKPPGSPEPGPFLDCEFHGRSSFPGFVSGLRFQNCRFVHAHVDVEPSPGDVLFEQCTFSGGDTAIVANPTTDNGLQLNSCRFEGMDVAVLLLANEAHVWANRCTFEDIGDKAVACLSVASANAFSSVRVWNSRFTRCRHAIHATSGANSIEVIAHADTIQTAFADGITVRPLWRGDLDSLLVSDVVGTALALTTRDRGSDPTASLRSVASARIGHTSIRSAGRGIVLEDSTAQANVGAKVSLFSSTVRESRVEGVRIFAETVEIESLLVAHGSGAGLEVALAEGADSCRIHHVTVADQGDGVRIVPSTSSWLDVTNVLSAFDAGAGIAVLGSYSGTVSRNDGWQNAGGDYVGVSVDSNLVADPLFCDRAAGDYHLHEGSPCSPSGPFGLIGALGVGCPATSHEPTVEWWGGNGSIHPGSNQMLMVGVLSDESFDATDLQHESIRLAGAPLDDRPHAFDFRDLDHDGREDVLLRFHTAALFLSPRDTVAWLDARTRSGATLHVALPIRIPRDPEVRDEGVAITPVRLAVKAVAFGLAAVDVDVPQNGPFQLGVVDVAGRLRAHRDVAAVAGRRRVDLTDLHLPSGCYFVTVRQGRQSSVARLLVLH